MAARTEAVEARPRPENGQERSVVDEVVDEALQLLYPEEERKARRKDVKAVLLDEEMEGEGVKGLRAFLQKHGFSVSEKTVKPNLLEGIGADNTISLYLKEISQYPLLSRPEEVLCGALVLLGRDGFIRDQRKRQTLEPKVEAAGERLVRGNLRLVIPIAAKYTGYGVPFLDLIQEGNRGLMYALREKYDLRKGTRPSTYATPWIKQYMHRAVPEQGKTIRIPVSKHDGVVKMKKTTRSLEQRLRRQPTEEEIAEEMAVRPKELKLIKQAAKQPVSLEDPVGWDRDSERIAFIPDESVERHSEVVERGALAERMEEVLATLTPREAKIIRLRYGLEDGRSYTLEEVGQMFGITRERIRQVQKNALRKLRHPRRARQLKGFL